MGAKMSAVTIGKTPSLPLSKFQRLEGGALAILTVVLFMLAGFEWWWLAPQTYRCSGPIALGRSFSRSG